MVHGFAEVAGREQRTILRMSERKRSDLRAFAIVEQRLQKRPVVYLISVIGNHVVHRLRRRQAQKSVVPEEIRQRGPQRWSVEQVVKVGNSLDIADRLVGQPG